MLTPDQELALAILLWKFYRSVKYDVGGPQTELKDKPQFVKAEMNMSVADAALEMAKRCGVKDEFLDLMFTVPVTTITIEELEQWEKTNTDLQDAVSPLPPKIERRQGKRYAERRKPTPKKVD